MGVFRRYDIVLSLTLKPKLTIIEIVKNALHTSYGGLTSVMRTISFLRHASRDSIYDRNHLY